MYYDFPLLSRRICLRDVMDAVNIEQCGRGCVSPPPEFFNSSCDSVPLGPFACGDEEWKRFEGTVEGADARTNKDVGEAEEIHNLFEEEYEIAARETAEEKAAYVAAFLERSRRMQRLLGDAVSQDDDADQEPEGVPARARASPASGKGSAASVRAKRSIASMPPPGVCVCVCVRERERERERERAGA